DMIFNSHACTCALNGGARNRSGSMKTSAVAVRSVLRDGLENPSRYQTARTGLAALKAVKLYRDGRKEDTSRFAPSPWKGDAASAAGRPLHGGRWLRARQLRAQ
ncbi:hypothetical protein, partial [Acidovorax sp. BoFeN1]|uniref:hypothetical protein n=1 Tax=Acidovorax sp. BoFeN1 TaxID=1231053 RepID=UPI001F3F8C52